jgi:hypothetical protein
MVVLCATPMHGMSNVKYLVMIFAACMFILGFATTWGPGIWILIGETFPTRTRARQGALSTASNWCVAQFFFTLVGVFFNGYIFRLWNFLIAFFTPFITSAIQFRYGFVFAGKIKSVYGRFNEGRILTFLFSFSLQSAWCNGRLLLPL